MCHRTQPNLKLKPRETELISFHNNIQEISLSPLAQRITNCLDFLKLNLILKGIIQESRNMMSE